MSSTSTPATPAQEPDEAATDYNSPYKLPELEEFKLAEIVSDFLVTFIAEVNHNTSDQESNADEDGDHHHWAADQPVCHASAKEALIKLKQQLHINSLSCERRQIHLEVMEKYAAILDKQIKVLNAEVAAGNHSLDISSKRLELMEDYEVAVIVFEKIRTEATVDLAQKTILKRMNEEVGDAAIGEVSSELDEMGNAAAMSAESGE